MQRTQGAPQMLSDDVFAALATAEARLDPYPVLAEYRRERPVVETGLGVVFFTRYDDCLTLLRDRRFSVDERNAPITGVTEPDDYPTLIKVDPPDHDRLRRLVQAAFTPRRVDALRHRAEGLVAAAIDEFDGGGEVDLIDAIAYPVPLAIITELIGVESEDAGQVREWSTWLARSIDPAVFRTPELNARIQEAEEGFVAFIQSVMATRRRSPGGDVLSQLVMLEMDGDRLTERELIGMTLLLLVAGHETTVNLIGNGMLALLRSPEQWRRARLVSDPKRTVDELLRFDSPIQMTSRIALEPVNIGGTAIATGDIAVLLLGAANHDPAAFDNPDALDVTTTRHTQHLAFGQGIHHCLGAALARAEGEAAITALVNTFPNMELIEEPAIRPAFVVRGREHLRVHLGRREVADRSGRGW